MTRYSNYNNPYSKIDLITFDIDTAKEFEEKHHKACIKGQETFTYKGYKLKTTYAGYQVDFLHTIFQYPRVQ